MRNAKILVGLGLLIGILALSLPAQGPTFGTGGNISAGGADCSVSTRCVSIQLPVTAATLSVTITGTYSGTLVLEESGDYGTTWTTAQTTTSTGLFVLPVASLTNFRVRCSSYSSGVAGVNFQASSAPQDGAAIQVATVTLSSAQILALHSTPITIIPAPGTGKAINVIGMVGKYIYSSTPYTLGVMDGISVAPSSAPQNEYCWVILANGFLDQSASTYSYAQLGVSEGTSAHVENTSFVLSEFNGAASFTNGNGAVKISVYYTVVNFN